MTQNPRRIFALTTGIVAAISLTSCAKKVTELHATIDTSMGKIVVKLFPDTAPITVANFVGLADGTRLLAKGQPVSAARPFYDGLIIHRVIPDFMIQGGDPKGDGAGGPGYTFEDETYAQGSQKPLTGKIEDVATAEFVFRGLVLPYLQRRQDHGQPPSQAVLDLFREVNETQSFTPVVGKTVEEISAAVGRDQPLVGPGRVIHSVDYGSIAMANRGPNTNGSQFFIVTRKGGVPWLNGKHTVFGEVIQGMDVAEAISKVKTGDSDRPDKRVVINSIRVQKVKVTVKEATR